MTRQKRHEFSQQQFGERLASALELNPHAPPKFHGERVWLSEEMLKRGKKVTPETIRKWINGSAAPTHDKVPALAETLGVDVDWLLYGETTQAAPVRPRHSDQASAATNIVAGIVQMNGGDALFPAKASGSVHLHAVIDRASYPLHITMGERQGDEVEFLVPPKSEDVIVVGVVQREGEFAYDLFEVDPEKHPASEIRRGKLVVRGKPDEFRAITSFAERL